MGLLGLGCFLFSILGGRAGKGWFGVGGWGQGRRQHGTAGQGRARQTRAGHKNSANTNL